MDLDFLRALTYTVLKATRTVHGRENWNHLRFGKRKTSWRYALVEEAMLKLNPVIKRAHVAIIPTDQDIASKFDTIIERWGNDLSFLYNLLEDNDSKGLLVELVAYQILGYRQMRLSTNTPAYWAQIDKAVSLICSQDQLDAGLLNWKLDCFDLRPIGYPLKVYSRANSVAVQYMMEHYSYSAINPPISPSVGDRVIDAGAGWGDAALYFGLKVGPTGKVFAFEFEPVSLNVLATNLAMNSDIAQRIQVVPKALWSKSDVELYFGAKGPGTRVQDSGCAELPAKVQTVSIDDFVKHIGKIDFIKMDIEGAEQEALRGGRETICRYAPKLAISVYHSIDDLCRIPRFLSSLGVPYRYFLKHCTIQLEETVLFATVDDRK